MKTIFLFALPLLLAGNALVAQTTQVVNSNIRAELQFTELWTDADGDDAITSQDDPAMRFWPESTSNANWGEACITWNCNAPCSYNPPNFSYGINNASYNEFLDIYLLAYESDNDEWCTWYTDDDYAWEGWAYLWHNGRITDSQESVWDNNNGVNGSEWLFNNSPHFNAKARIAWRYVAGETKSNPLNFGIVGPNNTIQHYGSNYPNPSGQQTTSFDLGWKDDEGNTSPDVYFSFNLNQHSQVIISTDFEYTNYDSYLVLYNGQGTPINYDDDSGDNGAGNKAEILTTLSPGNYIVRVEGYQGSTGKFQLDIGASVVSAAEEQFAAADWSVFPNPAKDHVTVNIQSDDLDADARLSVLDLLGRELLAQDARAGTQELDLSALGAGVYAVQIRSGNAAGVRKVIVE